MPDITVSVKGDDGMPVQITISLSDDAYQVIMDLAKRRGRDIGEVVAEALRLERLLADKKLLFVENGRIRELASA